MLFDIKLVLIIQKASLKVHSVINIGTRNVDMSTREGVNGESCNSKTRITCCKAEISSEPM